MRPEFVLAGVIVLASCGASGAREPGAPTGSSPKVAAADPADAGAASTEALDAAPAGKPFAASPSQATQLIGTAIDKHAAEVKKCLADYRTRKKLPHERVEISVGIDQEGRLLGAALKGAKQDATFSACVQSALASAPFPRSHAGVIQVTKSYEEIEQ